MADQLRGLSPGNKGHQSLQEKAALLLFPSNMLGLMPALAVPPIYSCWPMTTRFDNQMQITPALWEQLFLHFGLLKQS